MLSWRSLEVRRAHVLWVELFVPAEPEQTLCRVTHHHGSIFAIHMSLENLRGLEDHDPALLNRHLDACLGVAAYGLALAAHDEIAEAREFHALPYNRVSLIFPKTSSTNLADSARERPTFW